MPSAFRRLATDHAVLHDDLPPNYLFPPDETFDDLTQLSIFLAGPQGTPYSKGLWRLHLRMPDDYPKNPPKATFRTRIWHPNVEETTGAVCVDTLKRDWKTTLTLKDVLITISCLLIHPNPDSALNSTAGALQQEDYDAFARQARLMSSIHAPVPTHMKNAVMEAKLRGEDAGAVIQEQQEESHSSRSRKGTRVQSVTMKKKPSGGQEPGPSGHGAPRLTPQPQPQPQPQNSDNENDENDENEDENMPSKENDPSLSPSPVKFAPPSPRKNALGKRPLSVLTMPPEHDPFTTASTPSTENPPMDTDLLEEEEEDDNGRIMMTASEKNIVANNSHHREHNYPGAGDDEEEDHHTPPQRKSPKLSILNRSTNSSGRVRDDINYTNASGTTEDVDIGIFEDAPPPIPSSSRRPRHHRLASGDGKENRTNSKDGRPKTNRRIHPGTHTINPANPALCPPSALAPSTSASTSTSATASPAATPSSSQKPSSSSLSARSTSGTGARKVSSSSRQKPRIGIRRL